MEKIRVKGKEIGIIGLKEVFEYVKNLSISDEDKKEEIFKRIKEKNYIPPNVEEDFKESLWREYRKYMGEKVEEEKGYLEIKVLGAGCPRCEALLKNVRNALSELKIEAEIFYIKDIKEIAKYKVFSTPVLIINENVVTKGEVPSKEKIKELILKYKEV
jgi:small redox-active disulfide protein 2